jgi:hypothetical protein
MAEALASIGEFIERTYNQKRLHSALGYRPLKNHHTTIEEGCWRKPICHLRGIRRCRRLKTGGMGRELKDNAAPGMVCVQGGAYMNHLVPVCYAAFFLEATFFLVAAFFAITFFSAVFTAGFFTVTFFTTFFAGDFVGMLILL